MFIRDAFVFAVKIEHLTGNHAGYAAAARDFINCEEALPFVDRAVQARAEHRLKREVQKTVAGENRLTFPEYDVIRRSSAAEAVVVHSGQIIVNQRIGMNHFDCARKIQRVVRIFAQHIHRRQQHRRTQTLSTRKQAVAHGFDQQIRLFADLVFFAQRLRQERAQPIFNLECIIVQRLHSFASSIVRSPDSVSTRILLSPSSSIS